MPIAAVPKFAPMDSAWKTIRPNARAMKTVPKIGFVANAERAKSLRSSSLCPNAPKTATALVPTRASMDCVPHGNLRLAPMIHAVKEWNVIFVESA